MLGKKVFEQAILRRAEQAQLDLALSTPIPDAAFRCFAHKEYIALELRYSTIRSSTPAKPWWPPSKLYPLSLYERHGHFRDVGLRSGIRSHRHLRLRTRHRLIG